MTALTITGARLLDPASGTDEIGGIMVVDGQISKVGPDVTAGSAMGGPVIDAKGLCLSPGLVDLRVKTGEPGEEHRETLATASAAAAAGGATTLVLMPDTRPVIGDAALVTHLRAPVPLHGSPTVRLEVAGALTVDLAGKAMAEMGLMAEAGAVFFSNGDEPVTDPVVLKRAMAYGASQGVLIASRPDTPALRGNGVMNSGGFAARLGLSGIPKEAEWIGAARDILLAEVTGCRLLLDQVSTPRTLDLVADAKARGVNVYASVAAHHLFFNEMDVGDYLTYCKVNPPFRSEADRLALVEGVKAGVIDAVVSAHDPQPPETKRLPISEASFGAAGLETTLSAMMSLVEAGHLSLLEALKPLTVTPADLIGRQQGRLAVGAPADLILFDPFAPWKCKREHLRSRSTNSPFDGRLLQGQVMRTILAGVTVFDRAAERAAAD
ncbi:MAG: dihydroorotase [Pseudomonadota bacterium]